MHLITVTNKYKAVLIIASFIGAIAIMRSYSIENKDQLNIVDIIEKNTSRTFITLEDDKYDSYTFCPHKEVNEYKGWRGHFITSENNTAEKNFIPTNVKDAPVGFATTIPTVFLIEEIEFCTKRPNLKSIAYVHTAITNVERRAITRATWGRASDEVGVIFVVGIAKNKEEENIISSESQLHRDIVQGNYTDLYQLLVYKNLNAWYWINKNCNWVKWVVHADDDVLFDVTKFLTFTNSNIKGNYSRKIYCNMMCSGKVVRDNGSKWVVSEKEYPFKYFPIYCMGSLWFASLETVKQLLDVVPLVKYLWVDDTFVTGLLPEKAGIQRYRIDIPDSFQLTEISKFYGWRSFNTERIKYWNDIVSFYQQNVILNP